MPKRKRRSNRTRPTGTSTTAAPRNPKRDGGQDAPTLEPTHRRGPPSGTVRPPQQFDSLRAKFAEEVVYWSRMIRNLLPVLLLMSLGVVGFLTVAAAAGKIDPKLATTGLAAVTAINGSAWLVAKSILTLLGNAPAR